eukprot:1160932-Pelagomonas_calceolata.AAC.8
MAFPRIWLKSFSPMILRATTTMGAKGPPAPLLPIIVTAPRRGAPKHKCMRVVVKSRASRPVLPPPWCSYLCVCALQPGGHASPAHYQKLEKHAQKRCPLLQAPSIASLPDGRGKDGWEAFRSSGAEDPLVKP